MGTKLEVGVDGWGGLWLTRSRSALFAEYGDDRLKQVVPQVSHGYARLSVVRVPGMKTGKPASLNFNERGPKRDLGIEDPVGEVRYTRGAE